MVELEEAKAKLTAEQGTDAEVNKELSKMVYVDRRVISRKETIGYMLFDGSRSFNIDGHKDLFVDSILKISFDLQAKYNIIAGIWDVVDDFIVSFITEKTRTRWGKFIPYIFFGGFPYALLMTLYWLLPNLLPAAMVNDFGNITKFIIFAGIDMLVEFVGNFKEVAIGGYISTITPYPSDRRRLLSISSYFSIIYSRLPDLVVEFMLDFIKNGVFSSATKTSDQMIKSSLMTVGPVTALLSGVIISWYTSIAKERVHQKVEVPKIRESLRIVFTNRPCRAYIISNLLGSFGTGITTNDYYRQVLNMTTFETFAGIPSLFFQPFGFAKYNSLAKKFSTKSLYMVSQVFAKSLYIPLWFYGRFFKTKNGKMFFQSRIAMFPVTAIWECVYATFWGVKSISGSEIGNECNDYIEYKCGYRNEATLSAASTLVCKIPGRINNILQPLYKKWCNYDQTAYTEGREQPIFAQKCIFAMATILPAVLVMSSMIPMFWYNIDKDKRDKMYVELNERRIKTAEAINKQHSETEATEQ